MAKDFIMSDSIKQTKFGEVNIYLNLYVHLSYQLKTM